MPLVAFLNVPPIDHDALRPESPQHPPAGLLVMLLFLASLGVGFATALAFFLIMWSRADRWPPAGTPPLPGTLWLSTGLVIVASVTMQAAVVGARSGRMRLYRSGLLLTLLAGLAFLGSQTFAGIAFARALAGSRSMFTIGFYLLAGLHAAHVLGGLLPLAIVTRRAWRQAYVFKLPPGVLYCAMYWHFVDLTWLVIFLMVRFSRGAA